MSELLRDLTFTGPDLRLSNGRGYTHPITSDVVPGVTAISGLLNKPHLVKWAAKSAAKWAADNHDALTSLPAEARTGAIAEAAEIHRNQAREIGSLAHWVIEQLAQRLPCDIPDTVAHQVQGWRTWANTCVAGFIHNEATVWSHKHGYAGTFDAIVRLRDGRSALVDYKTGSNVYPEAGLQLWALRNADCIVTTDGEEELPSVDLAGVLHLPAMTLTPTGKTSTSSNWSFREIRTDPREEAAFLALLTAWHWEKEHSNGVIGGKRTSL